MKRKIALVMPMVLMVLSLASCTAKRVDENTESGPPPTDAGEVKEDYSQSTAKAVGEYEMYDPYIPYDPGYYDSFNYEGYEKAQENGFLMASIQPLSTFSASVDTASYSNVRRMIEDGYTVDEIPSEAVRAEEFINYFHYDLNLPKGKDKFGITLKMSNCPWNDKHKLVFVGLRTQDIDMSDRLDSNLVFLIDVSGSMDESNKLPLLVKSFKQLTENLTAKDSISIVTYADGVETVLSGAKGSEKEKIFDALDSLMAGGSTNGEGGIQKAYEVAKNHFIKGGINRVILATDGDLNVGISEPDELQRFIEEKRKTDIYLSVLGFGEGNLQDDNLERLANYGNGNYSYIDSLLEAKKVLVEEMGSTLVTVADDVKLQIEFNPANVNAYRLVGYENRMLNDSDFADDTKDAAEIGAGHSVVAMYEIIENGSSDAIELRYNEGKDTGDKGDKSKADEYAFIKIRYKEAGENNSKEVSYPLTKDIYKEEMDDDFKFASLAAEFAQILSNSRNRGTATLESIMEDYKKLAVSSDEYKNEFYYLVRKLSGNN